MMRGCLLWLGVVLGCAESATVICGDGRVCGPNTVCDDAHGLCVLPTQLDACRGVADGLDCAVPGIANGVCLDGVCLGAGCGNSLVEPNEICDDGNTANGDGCSADCLSLETCGNGIVDAAMGESCDDGNMIDTDDCHNNCRTPLCGDGVLDSQFGEVCDEGDANSLLADAECRPNCQPRRCGDGIHDVEAGEICDDGGLLPGDGCTPDCLSNETCGNGYTDFLVGETCDDENFLGQDGCSGCSGDVPQWRRHQHGTPAGRMLPAMAYDPIRDRVVLFGGAHPRSVPDNRTWELVGSTWIERFPNRVPPARAGAQMAYDLERREMVLFGGEQASANDTWLYDGTTWREAPTSGARPSARTNHVMAYDVRRKRVLLVGGGNMGGAQAGDFTLASDSAWEWDGSQWTPIDSPGPRIAHSLAYDPVAGTVLLYGGSSASDGDSESLYRFTNNGWDDISPGGPALAGASLVYDSTNGRMLLVGGRGNTTTYALDVEDGWVPLSAPLPSARSYFGAISRPAHGDMILFGGGTSLMEIDNPTPALADTLRWTGSSWTQLAAAPAPPPAHTDGAMTFDIDRGVAIAFGGRTGNQTLLPNATYVHRDEVWTSITPAGSPPARHQAALAYDGARRETVLFGGIDGALTAPMGDTWTFDGTSWTQKTPATSPSPRRLHTMVYDAGRKRVVLFGGLLSGSATVSGELWEWDGTTWLLRTPGPPGRQSAGMAYDARRQRTVLYGGFGAGVTTATWEWDGTTWTAIESSAVPPFIANFSMTYDPMRGRVVLFGGGSSGTNSNETWEWDGVTWRPLTLATSTPGGRYRQQATYDPLARTLLLHAGSTASLYTNDTWSYTFGQTEATRQVCGLGVDGDRDGLIDCADPDCWGRCTPHCPPSAPCDTTLPRCGDDACSPLESPRLCPADCGAPVVRCGDLICEGTETATSCPGDC